MQELPKRTSKKEFREQVVKLLVGTRGEAGKRLSLSAKALDNGIIAARQGALRGR